MDAAIYNKCSSQDAQKHINTHNSKCIVQNVFTLIHAGHSGGRLGSFLIIFHKMDN